MIYFTGSTNSEPLLPASLPPAGAGQDLDCPAFGHEGSGQEEGGRAPVGKALTRWLQDWGAVSSLPLTPQPL